MKKLIAASLSLAMLFGLTACGGKDDDTPIEKPSAVATQAKTEATTSDVIQYDPLEDYEIEITESTEYPKNLYMNYKYSFEDSRELECINFGKVISADSKKIIIEVSVDEEKVAELFGDTPYILKKTKKEIVFDTKDICTFPLYAENISDDTVVEIGNESKKLISKAIKEYSNTEEYNNELSIEAVYAVTLARDETYITNYQLTEKKKLLGEHIDIWPKGTPNPYQLWFAYKNEEGKVFIQSTSKCRIRNRELFDYGFGPYSLYDTDKSYDSLEEAKVAIEDYIAKYDNVKLEELKIPEALK